MNDLQYQEMIYNKLVALDTKMSHIFPYTDTTPELKGGTRARQHPLPGITLQTYEPSTLAVEGFEPPRFGGRQMRDMRYRGPRADNTILTQLHGGNKEKRIDIVKRIMKEKGLNLGEASKYVKEHKLYKKLDDTKGKEMLKDLTGGKKVNRLKKANRWKGFAVDALNEGMTLADRGAELVKKHGGTMEMEMEGGKKVNRLKKANRWKGFAVDALNEGMTLADRGATLAKKHGGSRPPSVWIQFVKAYSKKHNIPYNKALKEAGPEYKKLKM
jgi:hypothetical protein